MDTIGFLRFLAASGIILALIALMAWVLKRWPVLRGIHSSQGQTPRLRVIEQRGLDPRYKLVLVQRDDVQHLLILSNTGQPQIIETGIAAPAPVLVEAKELS